MSYYSKTELGWQRLNNRDGNLNARQRRLLVLIGSEDFNDLNPTQKNLFAPNQLIEELLNMDLITYVDHTKSIPVVSDSIQSDTQNKATQPSNYFSTAPHLNPNIPIPELLSFEQVKSFMIQHLNEYCGLMASQHIQKIQQAAEIQALKRCQMQWITLLQESRMLPQTLRQSLKQINLSLDHLSEIKDT